jgi:hypothetical protein
MCLCIVLCLYYSYANCLCISPRAFNSRFGGRLRAVLSAGSPAAPTTHQSLPPHLLLRLLPPACVLRKAMAPIPQQQQHFRMLPALTVILLTTHGIYCRIADTFVESANDTHTLCTVCLLSPLG